MTLRGRRAWRVHAIRRPDGPNNGRRRGAAQAACAIRGARSLLGTAGKGAYGAGIVKGRDLAFMGRACSARMFHRASRSLTSGLAVLGLCALLVGQETAGQWPRQVETPQGQCMVFQPQPAAIEGDRLSARAALAVTPAGSTNVVFGIAQLEARAVQDSSGKATVISEVALTQVSFAPANAAAMAGLADALKPDLSKVTWSMPSDTLRAGLDAVEGQRAAARGLAANAPRILYSQKPAALIVLDGAPQLRQIPDSTMQRVVNTPYAMVFDPASQRYWLRGSFEWFSAADWRGEWTPAAQPPAEVATALPAEVAGEAPTVGRLTTVSPQILISTEPAELIVTQGEATYAPVAGSDLLYVSNSEQLLFFTLDTKEYYVALSGRWYRGPALSGPWDAVAADALPPAFSKITPGSPKSEALTYVAGTVEAQDAVVQAAIPQITAVERGPADVEVEYEGAAQFQPVEGTSVQYAANTVDAVFLVGGNYYMCRDAVWYTGPGPDGPWSVATFVPTEIQSLPPSNPHYNVKYVYVYGVTPQEVYVGYEPGYSGSYVYGPTVVYGTGWWYPGYYGPSYYWAYPATFGFGFSYNSWSGWSVGFGWGYSWLGCGYRWGWGGCYPWGWWGPRRAYWASAPRYPHYEGHSHGRGGHGGYGGYGRGGPPVRSGDHAGVRPGSRPDRPSGGMRPDVPGPNDRANNAQRRSLPSYARTARAPYQQPTALRPAQGAASRSNVGGGPSQLTQSSRPQVPTSPGSMSQRSPQARPGDAGSPSRSTVGRAPDAVTNPVARREGIQPGRSVASSSSSSPARTAPARNQTVASRQPAGVAGGVPGGSSAAPNRVTGERASRPAVAAPVPRPNTISSGPSVRSSSPAVRSFSPPARSMPSQSPVSMRGGSWPGSRPTYAPSAPQTVTRSPSIGGGSVYRSAPSRAPAPSYGTMSPTPSMRAPVAAPSAPTRGSYSSRSGAPMGSAPTRSSGGFYGGAPSPGGSSRGR